MSYPSTVYNVMISYPSDAEEERRAIRDCINRWNDVHSEGSGMVLLPLDYKTHVPPLLASQGDERAQAVINEYIVKSSDWLVVVFKNKIGTHTGKAESGTLEEIELFQKSNPQKPISVYFYKETQDDKVKQYKEQLKGIWGEYKDCQDLENNFFINLSQVVNKNTYFQQKLVGSYRRLEEKSKILLVEGAKDTGSLIIVSKLAEQELQIETNGGKYFGYEAAFEYLCRKRLIEKLDPEGEVFSLTDLGKQEVEALKSI